MKRNSKITKLIRALVADVEKFSRKHGKSHTHAEIIGAIEVVKVNYITKKL